MVTYNDWPLVKRAVESLIDKVDAIIAVDGRYSAFPGDTQYSTDGTLEYLGSLNKVSLVLSPPLTEVEKRNLYLVGSGGDWYLHLDADEELVGSFTLPDTDIGIMELHRSYPIRIIQRARLFRHVPGIHYEGKHYWLKDKNGNTYCLLDKAGSKYSASPIEGCKIVHYDEERPPERQRDKKQYYRWLSPRENRIEERL